MKTRIITGFVIGVLLIALCVFAETAVLPCAVTVLTFIGVGEFLHCTGLLGKLAVALPSFGFALAADILLFTCSDIRGFFLCFSILSQFLVLVLFAVSTFSKGKIPVDGAFAAFSGTYYVTFGFASLELICIQVDSYDSYLLAMTIFLPLISDIFAYFTGYFFGKHKLIPDVSPKKTVEGAVGGMIACGIGCAVFVDILRVVNGSLVFGDAGFAGLQIRMFAVGLVCSVVAQAGDLIMSVIKRRYGVKDYGRLFPGHGGVLDRFDSVLAVSTVMLALTFVPGLVFFGA